MLRGHAWVFGDSIDTDLIAPGAYLKFAPEEMAVHCLETVAPDFAKQVRQNDLVVAGDNFGLGSSREQAAQCLKFLGVDCVLAKSFARIFYRNALNLGLPALVLDDADQVSQGDKLEVDIETGQVRNLTTGANYACPPIPGHLLPMLRDGGLIAHLQKRIARGEL